MHSLVPFYQIGMVVIVSIVNFGRYMNLEEVRAWIIPPDFDHTEAEAKHLMEESDTDSDEKLTKQVQ